MRYILRTKGQGDEGPKCLGFKVQDLGSSVERVSRVG